jgi:hypothetical protein
MRFQSGPSTPEHSTVALLIRNNKLKEIMIVISARNAINNLRKLMYILLGLGVGVSVNRAGCFTLSLLVGIYHIPSSCMVIMVHVVNDCQHSMLIHAQSRRWSLRTTLDLESDKSRCFNHRDGVDSNDSAVQLPKFRSVGSWTVCYI